MQTVRRTFWNSAVLAAAALAPAAMADHAHLTVDTQAGQIKIVAGYLFGEDGYEIDGDGWLRLDGEIVTVTCDQIWGGTPYTRWPIAVEQMTLTSDYFGATGRLDGGYFWYELASVTPVDGEPGTELVWGRDSGGELTRIATSEGATRQERSFELGFIGHVHEQRQLLSAAGLYEVAIVAWDSNGVYADSAPVRFYIEAPGCDADINGDGDVNTQDVVAFLNLWAAGDDRADWNGDGGVDSRDFLAFLNAWVAGC